MANAQIARFYRGSHIRNVQKNFSLFIINALSPVGKTIPVTQRERHPVQISDTLARTIGEHICYLDIHII